MHGDDGGDGDALLLAAGQGVGRPVEQLVYAQVRGDVGDEPLDLVSGEAQLQRAEGELVAHVGAEELDVRVLEDEADAGPEVTAERRVLERVFGERGAEGEDLAGAGEDQAVEHLQQRRLAGPVRADDGDVLAGLDLQVDPGQGGSAGAVLVAHAAEDEVGRVPPIRLRGHAAVRRRHAVPRPAASASAHTAMLAASHSQSAGPARNRRSDGMAPV